MENFIIKSEEELELENFKSRIQRLKDAPGIDAPVVLENIYSETVSGFFKRKIVKKFEGQYVQRKGNYITLRGIAELLNEYLNVIIQKKDIFVMNIIDRYFNYNISIEEIKIFYENYILELSTDYFDKKLKVNCSSIPALLKGNTDNYNMIKGEVYNFVSVLQLYDKYLRFFKDPIYITDNISLNVESSDILNYITHENLIKFSLSIKFGDNAILECQYKDNEANLLAYSRNELFNQYLREHKKELFNEIFIDESKISVILSTISNLAK